MNPQLSMFQPLARTSDPMPSHIAAAEMLNSAKRETECAAILDALKGSSISRTDGRQASARAMATRCCMPPDNCQG